MAVVQSCFESSVNALPWINVICGISQVAAGLLRCGGRQPENSRKRRAFTTVCSHFFVFIYFQCRASDHTHQPGPKGSPNHFSNLIKNTQGFPFLWQLLHGQCDGLRSFISCRVLHKLHVRVANREKAISSHFNFNKISCCECVPEL